MKWALAVAALSLLASCRREEASEPVEPSGREPASSVGEEEPAADTAAGLFMPETPPVEELRGFDQAGPVSCLPLPAGRRCLTRLESLHSACAAKKGELRRCEDCRPVCSVAP